MANVEQIAELHDWQFQAIVQQDHQGDDILMFYRYCKRCGIIEYRSDAHEGWWESLFNDDDQRCLV